MDFRIPYNRKKGMETEVESTVRTVRISYRLYGPYDCYFVTDFKKCCVVFWKFWHVSQGGRTSFIALFWIETVGTYFEASIQHFGGTKIEEQTCNLLQKILERILRSLAYFLCEDLARLLR
jgi:hypothetical protein